MKFNGKKPNAGNVVKVVIPRQDGGNILFIAKGIFDYSEFYKRHPQPKAPKITKPGGVTEYLHDDKKYLESIQKWAELKNAWIILTSLADTPNLEWETVKMDDSKTWCNYEKELKEVFLPQEINAIINAVTTACALSGDKIEEATQSFLLGLGMEVINLSSPSIENLNMLSSEPAND